MYKINNFSKKGYANDKFNKDAIYINDYDDEILICSLADGLNSKKFSKEGAEICQAALSEYVIKHPKDYFLNKELFIKECVITIKEAIYKKSVQKKINVDEFSSTLIFLIFFKKKNIVVWLHLGDGIVAIEDKGDNVKILSYPHNGTSLNNTYSTNTRNLLEYMFYGECKLNDIKKVIMFTDGAMLPLYEKNKFTKKGEKLIVLGIETVQTYLESVFPNDDYSGVEICME